MTTGRYPYAKTRRMEVRIDENLARHIDNIVDYVKMTRPVKRRSMYMRTAVVEAMLLALLASRGDGEYTPRELNAIMAVLTPALKHIAEQRTNQKRIMQ